jgi:hypothetical protein
MSLFRAAAWVVKGDGFIDSILICTTTITRDVTVDWVTLTSFFSLGLAAMSTIMPRSINRKRLGTHQKFAAIASICSTARRVGRFATFARASSSARL